MRYGKRTRTRLVGVAVGAGLRFANATLRCRWSTLASNLALLTGDDGLIDGADWSLFPAAGTVHLMVVFGIHLTIVTTLGVALGHIIARLRPVLLARGGTGWLGTVSAAWC